MKNPLTFTFMKNILTLMLMMLPSVLRHNDEFKSNYELDGQLGKARESFDFDPKDFAPFIYNFLAHKEIDGIFSIEAPYTFNLKEALSTTELQPYEQDGLCERLSYEEIQVVNKLMKLIQEGMKKIGLDVNTELVEHPHPKEQILVFGNCPTLTASFEYKKGYLAFINLNYMLGEQSQVSMTFATKIFFRHVVDYYFLGAPNLTGDNDSRLMLSEAGVKLEDDISNKLFKLYKDKKKSLHCVGTLLVIPWGNGSWSLKECGFPNPLHIILLHAAYDNKYAALREIRYVVDPSPRTIPLAPPIPIISTKILTKTPAPFSPTTIITTNLSNSNYVFFTNFQGIKKSDSPLEESSKVPEYEFGEEQESKVTIDYELGEGGGLGF